MAEAGSWPSIHKHGLLSTSALLDLFGVSGVARHAIEGQHRPECVSVLHDLHGAAVIRDQKPMDGRGLVRALQDGLSPEEWYRLLNRKVFFWLTLERLTRLLAARAYRSRRQAVITVVTRTLIDRHARRVLLSPMNSGATKPMPHPRGRNTFVSVPDCPFDEWKRKRGSQGAVAELTVDHSVPDIRDLVVRVDEVGGGEPLRNLLCLNAEPAPYDP
jgi:hypothetical protein